MKKNKPLVSIVMGSDSDLSVMNEAAGVLESFGIECEVKIISAHRSPEYLANYASSVHKRGFRVVIAGAGGAAHLPGVFAAHTHLPVIGVPVKSKSLDGLDSMLSIVQMPPGVPVATVGIGASKNAGLLAVQILALSDSALSKKYISYKKKLNEESLAKNKKIVRN